MRGGCAISQPDSRTCGAAPRPPPTAGEPICMLRVILAQPRGFCAGVERAIEIVERALNKYGPPIYVRHEIVHNRHVVENLRTRGAVFVDELDQVPPGAMTVFSAHGVARRVEELARNRALPVIDATCPLVAKVHNEGRRYAAQGRDIVLVGHAGHAEVEGTIGQIDGTVHLVQTVADVAALVVHDPEKLAYITQTTLVGRRHARDHRRPDGAVSGDRRAGRARHLLCHAESPAGGAGPGRGGRPHSGRGLEEQQQFQSAAGDRRRAGQARLPDRRRRRAALRMVRGRGVGRGHGGGLGAGNPGAGGDRGVAAVRRRSTSPPWTVWPRTCASASLPNLPTPEGFQGVRRWPCR